MNNPFDEIIQRLDKIEALLNNTIKIEKREKMGVDKVPVKWIIEKRLLSKPTLYKYFKEGKIVCYKLGGRSYVDVKQFNEAFGKTNKKLEIETM